MIILEETVVYFIRHSEIFNISNYNVDEAEQVTNEKKCLSIRGENLAKEIVNNCNELTSVDKIYTSHYVRAIQTAKYIAERNNLNMIVDYRLGERKIGIKGNVDYCDFERQQFKDFDYKLNGGESINQVNKRVTEVVKEILSLNEGKKIVIVTHATTLVALFSNWCERGFNFDGKLILDFKDKNIYDGDMQPMQMYKARFDGLKLIDIERI